MEPMKQDGRETGNSMELMFVEEEGRKIEFLRHVRTGSVLKSSTLETQVEESG